MPAMVNMIGFVIEIRNAQMLFSLNLDPLMAKFLVKVSFFFAYSTLLILILILLFSFAAAKQELIKSKLPNSVLSKIWKLSDVDGDGFLDSDEFALALHLINVKLEGNELPNVLPDHLVPPSKRC